MVRQNAQDPSPVKEMLCQCCSRLRSQSHALLIVSCGHREKTGPLLVGAMLEPRPRPHTLPGIPFTTQIEHPM